MRRQRGIIAFWVLELIGGIALVGILWGTAHMIKKNYDTVHEQVGAAAKEKELEPKITGLEKSLGEAQSVRDQMIATNTQLKRNYTLLAEERRVCSAAVSGWQATSDRVAANRAAREAADAARRAGISADRVDAIASLGLPDPRTCEEREAASGAMWRKWRNDQLRDFPPADPTKLPTSRSSDVTIKGTK